MCRKILGWLLPFICLHLKTYQNISTAVNSSHEQPCQSGVDIQLFFALNNCYFTKLSSVWNQSRLIIYNFIDNNKALYFMGCYSQDSWPWDQDQGLVQEGVISNEDRKEGQTWKIYAPVWDTNGSEWTAQQSIRDIT